jgi:lysophospholipase L1-like esterase
VLAFGDSITNGGGELQWGVALQSWAQWVARGMGLPYTGYAVDGAVVSGVLTQQIPRFKRDDAGREARYDLGCLYIGVNDVRALDWDPTQFAAGHREALEFLNRHCDRVLTVTAPLDLGRPRAGARIPELNDAIAFSAQESGALVLDLSAFRARNHVMTDHVHPTAFGQIAIAQRALEVLDADGVRVRVRTDPASLIVYETTPWQRLRADATYLYRHAKASARALSARLANGPHPPSPPAGGGPEPE